MGTTTSGVGLESLEYRGETETYRAEYDPESIDPSMAVVAALSAVLDVGPVDLPPLYDAVDTDALDAIVRGRDGTDATVSVGFTVDDHAITVRGNGTVTVEPPHGNQSGDETGPNDAMDAARGR